MKSFFYILFFTLLSFEGLAQINFPALSGRNGNLLPTLVTTAASSITSTSAISGGNVTSDGGASVTTRGVVWGTSQNPTILSSLGLTTDGSGTGVFVSSITGLAYGTTYYVRSYATNILGTSYGNQVSFMTSILQIGDSYQGGKIYYILQNGDLGYNNSIQHGLIASENDLGPVYWIPPTPIFDYDQLLGIEIGKGKSNTNYMNSMIDSRGCCYSSQIARDHRGGNYTDWYLPSKNELMKMSENKGIAGISWVSARRYWSSSVRSANEQRIWVTNFFDPYWESHTNSVYSNQASVYVRPIRAF